MLVLACGGTASRLPSALSDAGQVKELPAILVRGITQDTATSRRTTRASTSMEKARLKSKIGTSSPTPPQVALSQGPRDRLVTARRTIPDAVGQLTKYRTHMEAKRCVGS